MIRGFEFDPKNLIGTCDPFSLVMLQPGERVIACKRCQVGYQSRSMTHLMQGGRNHCVLCGTSDALDTVVLPNLPDVVQPAVISPTPSVAHTNSQPIIGLADIEKHIGQLVDFKGFVHEVYRSARGHLFVKFEKTKSPIDGFRLVVFSPYLEQWRIAGVDWSQYSGHQVLVHGVVRDDPNWGIQMLIDRPELIKVIDGDVSPSDARPGPASSAHPPHRSPGITWRDPKGTP